MIGIIEKESWLPTKSLWYLRWSDVRIRGAPEANWLLFANSWFCTPHLTESIELQKPMSQRLNRYLLPLTLDFKTKISAHPLALRCLAIYLISFCEIKFLLWLYILKIAKLEAGGRAHLAGWATEEKLKAYPEKMKSKEIVYYII